MDRPFMKCRVTSQLATLIKTLRIQNGVSAKDLAAYLQKSPSFVSKLEGGSVRFIELDLLTQILCFSSSSDDFYGEVLPKAVKLLQGLIDKQHLVDQMWLIQYDVVERKVVVVPEMARDMYTILSGAGITFEYLAEFINNNVDSKAPAGFPANEFQAIDYGTSRRLLMRSCVPIDEVESIFSGKRDTINYVTLYTVVHALFRLRDYGNVTTKLPPDEAIVVLKNVAAYFDRWHIESLTDFGQYLSSDEFISVQQPLASQYTDKLTDIFVRLEEAAEHDSLQVAKQLETFFENIEWDLAFSLHIMGIEFAKLGDISFANKRKLLSDIEQLVCTYDEMSDFDKKIEVY